LSRGVDRGRLVSLELKEDGIGEDSGSVSLYLCETGCECSARHRPLSEIEPSSKPSQPSVMLYHPVTGPALADIAGS
jgi:hypothetical protein